MNDKIKIENLPTEFRAVHWDDGWEFDGPTVVYYPRKYRRYGFGGNAGSIDTLIEDICLDICIGKDPTDGGLLDEIKWRGWGNRFARRRNAAHAFVKVKWLHDSEGQLEWEIVDQINSEGPIKLPEGWEK